MNVKNVKDGQLWEQILKRREEIKKHNIQSWEMQTFPSHPQAAVQYLTRDWISNVVGKKELRIQDPHQVLVVCAQTGLGKTSMIFQCCLPIAKELGKKVLFLSSRSALCKKVKNDAMADELNGEEYVGNYKVKEFKEYFSEKYLDANIDFGLIHICSYQKFIRNKNLNLNPNDYAFVILDEYPSLFVDSLYSPLGAETLKKIICDYRYCRRIYLSATPQEALERVYDFECGYGCHENNICHRMEINYKSFRIFVMDQDYSYLQPKFYTQNSTLVEFIKQRSSENWIVFLRNKSVGNDLKEELEAFGLEVEFFTADSEKDTDMYQTLLSEEKLTKNIMLTTRVLDVGINIKKGTEGKKIFNICIQEDDPTEMIQMVGRKRVVDGEKLNVFFLTPSLKELKLRRAMVINRINSAKKQLASVEAGEFIEEISPPLYFDGKALKVNSFFMSKLNIDLRRYDYLIERMSECNSREEQNHVYANFILENFQGVSYDSESLFIENLDKELEKILGECLDKKISPEEFQSIALQLKDLLGDNRVKTSDAAPGIKKVKDLISEYGYTVASIGDPKMYTFSKEENVNVQ